MSISGVSTVAFPQTQPSQLQQQRTYFDQLQQSLSSGNLSGAQQAFASLQQNLPTPASGQNGNQTGSQTGNPNSPSSQIQQDFAAVGQALQSGDLSGAQQAFQKFQQDVQSAHHGRHHHRHAGGAGDAQASQGGAPVQGPNQPTDSDGDTSSVTQTSVDISVSSTTTTFSTTA
jgi:hypothetical protein